MDKASRIFCDRPLGAMDTAIYWINYVIEHRGAPHMVAAGVHLRWYQFYLLDVSLIILIITVLSLLTLYAIYKRLKSLRGKESFDKKTKSE